MLMTAQALVQIKNVSFKYDDLPILEDITCDVNRGEYLSIIGPNGGGKTTLLKIIIGLLKPSNGSVVSRAKLIGYVPQRIVQERSFPATVQEIIESGMTDREYDDLPDLMELFDVSRSKNRLISDLSGGERQRVFIVRALAGNPDMLVLDEPYVGIDSAAQERFYECLETLHDKYQMTIVMVSHDLEVVARTATRCLCINRRLQCQGVPKEILQNTSLEKLYGTKLAHIPHNHPL